MNRDLIGVEDLNRVRASVGAPPMADYRNETEQQPERLEADAEGGFEGEAEAELDDYDIIRSVAYYALKGGEKFGVAELVDTIRLRDPDDLRVEMLALLLTDIAREPLGARGTIGGERLATMLERDPTLAEAVREARDLIDAEREEGDAEVEQVSGEVAATEEDSES